MTTAGPAWELSEHSVRYGQSHITHCHSNVKEKSDRMSTIAPWGGGGGDYPALAPHTTLCARERGTTCTLFMSLVRPGSLTRTVRYSKISPHIVETPYSINVSQSREPGSRKPGSGKRSALSAQWTRRGNIGVEKYWYFTTPLHEPGLSCHSFHVRVPQLTTNPWRRVQKARYRIRSIG